MKLTSITIEERETTSQQFDYRLQFRFNGGGAYVEFNNGDDALKVAREFEWLAMSIRNTVEVDGQLNGNGAGQ